MLRFKIKLSLQCRRANRTAHRQPKDHARFSNKSQLKTCWSHFTSFGETANKLGASKPATSKPASKPTGKTEVKPPFS